MPKKFKGENSKAAEARARKESAKQEAAVKKQQEQEDAYWKDDDKHVNAKLQRKVKIKNGSIPSPSSRKVCFLSSGRQQFWPPPTKIFFW